MVDRGVHALPHNFSGPCIKCSTASITICISTKEHSPTPSTRKIFKHYPITQSSIGSDMSTSYVPQAGDDTQLRKQSTAEYKLQRLTELTRRLKEEEERKAIPVSQAAKEYASDLIHLDLFQRES